MHLNFSALLKCFIQTQGKVSSHSKFLTSRTTFNHEIHSRRATINSLPSHNKNLQKNQRNYCVY